MKGKTVVAGPGPPLLITVHECQVSHSKHHAQSREQQSPGAESLPGKVDIFGIEKTALILSLPLFIISLLTQAIIAKAKIGEEVGSPHVDSGVKGILTA